MAKSKKQTEFQEIDELESVYKNFSDEQLFAFTNRPFSHTRKKYRIAVNNEFKRRGLKIK